MGKNISGCVGGREALPSASDDPGLCDKDGEGNLEPVRQELILRGSKGPDWSSIPTVDVWAQLGRKNPRDQTNEEWWRDYDSWLENEGRQRPVPEPKPRQISSSKPSNPNLAHGLQATNLDRNTLVGRFRYLGHRTTNKGRLVLDFEHINTGTRVACFSMYRSKVEGMVRNIV